MKCGVLLICAVMVLSVPFAATGAFYRYYDEGGAVTVTNDLKSVPERYRSQVTVISEKELENRAKAREREERSEQRQAPRKQQIPHTTPQTVLPAPSTAAPVQATVAPVPAVTSSWLSRQLPLLKIAAIVLLLFAAVIYAGKVVSSLAPRPLAIVIQVAMFAALAVYLVKGMAGKVTAAFDTIKEGAGVAQKAVDKRSEKIEKQAE